LTVGVPLGLSTEVRSFLRVACMKSCGNLEWGGRSDMATPDEIRESELSNKAEILGCCLRRSPWSPAARYATDSLDQPPLLLAQHKTDCEIDSSNREPQARTLTAASVESRKYDGMFLLAWLPKRGRFFPEHGAGWPSNGKASG
jgi:hypothetical protein